MVYERKVRHRGTSEKKLDGVNHRFRNYSGNRKTERFDIIPLMITGRLFKNVWTSQTKATKGRCSHATSLDSQPYNMEYYAHQVMSHRT